MLSEQHKKLLTAYVDGELNPRQRKLAERLLHRSARARKLLDRLQSDSRKLAGLPRQKPPHEFAHQVLQHISQQPAPVPATPSTLVPLSSASQRISAARSAAPLSVVK